MANPTCIKCGAFNLWTDAVVTTFHAGQVVLIMCSGCGAVAGAVQTQQPQPPRPTTFT